MPGALLGGRTPTAALRALRTRRPPRHPARFARPRMARSADGSPRRPAALVAWPLDRSLATERRRSVRSLTRADAASESLPAARRRAELASVQQHEATMAGVLVDHAQGRACIADAGYDAEHIRSAIVARKMKAVIPSNPTRAIIHRYDKKLYRCRYLVECFFHKLKACRRIATRYEKTARNYLALIHLACALQWIDAQTSGR